MWGVVQAHVCLLLTAHGHIIRSTPPLNEQDAVVIAVLCAVLQPILIAVQWPSLSVPVLACRAPFLQIRRNRLLPQVERETCESPHSSVLAGPPTSQQRDSLLLRRLPSFDRWRRRGRSSPWSCLSL